MKRADFSWPLTDSFFEVAQDPVDWKYQVYVTSRKEYKNFKRYALLYGLEFNRGAYKISYVKRDGEKDRDPYFILDILGAKKTPFLENRTRQYLEDIQEINVSGTPQKRYDQYDYFRYRICKYRFILESVIEGTTVYKDTFLLGKYMEVLLENQLKEDLQGFPISETVVLERLNEAFDELKKYFPFVQNVNRMDMINTIRGRLMGSKVKTFPILNADERQYMMIRELFIHKQLSDPKTFRKDILRTAFSPTTDEEIATALSEEKLKMLPARKESDVWCQYCANREFCAACYVSDRG